MAGQSQDANVKWNERRQVWELRYTERLDNGAYRSRAVSTGVKDIGAEHQAQIFKAEWLAHQRVLDTATGEPRVGELIDAYARHILAKGAHRNIKYLLRNLDKMFHSARPSTLNAETITARMSQRGLAQGSVVTELSTLKTVLRFACKTGALPQDFRIDLPIPRAPQGRVDFLDEIEEPEFYALACGHSIGKPRLTSLTKFACLGLDTGARKSAILGLTWDRVDMKSWVIDYREPGLPQSKKRRAVVPVNMRLKPVLERAHAERTRADKGLVCGVWSCQKPWLRFVAETPYPWMTPHVMRHTFITLLLRAGVEISEVAELVADTPQTIWKTYKHVKSTWLRHAVDARFTKEPEGP